MEIIKQMLTGQMPMSEFIQHLRTDRSLQDALRQLIPHEAVNNPDHVLWRKYSYETAKKYDFDCLAILCGLHRMNGSIGDNLGIYGTVRAIYRHYEPDLNYTSQYHDAHDVYLRTVGEYYEGLEVTPFLNQIVAEALPIRPKYKRDKILRERLKEVFHVVGKNRPYWIQGGEWPMGKNSPMQYIGRERIPDGVRYTFRDVDTDETRTIEQYY